MCDSLGSVERGRASAERSLCSVHSDSGCQHAANQPVSEGTEILIHSFGHSESRLPDSMSGILEVSLSPRPCFNIKFCHGYPHRHHRSPPHATTLDTASLFSQLSKTALGKYVQIFKICPATCSDAHYSNFVFTNAATSIQQAQPLHIMAMVVTISSPNIFLNIIMATRPALAAMELRLHHRNRKSSISFMSFGLICAISVVRPSFRKSDWKNMFLDGSPSGLGNTNVPG